MAGKRLAGHARLLLTYLGANLSMAMEYRAAFFSQVFGMLLNNSLWLAYWALFFYRFPVVKGWERADVLMLWAVIAAGFGLSTVLFGAWRELSGLIANGQLDYYLVLPKSPLWHALMSRAAPTGWGDLVFGLVVFAIWGGPTWPRTIVYGLCCLAVGGVLLGFNIVAHSLAFYVGSAESLAHQVENAVIHFSTYPGAIFDGAVRVVLFTVIPAGFINSVPVTVMRHGNLAFLGLLWLVAVGWIAAGQLAFRAGLRRYESGNLLGPRL